MPDGIDGDTLAFPLHTLAEKGHLYTANTVLCGKLGIGIMAYENILGF